MSDRSTGRVRAGRRRAAAAAVAVVALVAAGCSSDGGGDGSAFSVVTWNAGLADGFVDFVAERTASAAEAVADLDADVVFVQEVWQPEAVEAMTGSAGERFPHTAFLDPLPEDEGEAATVEVACGGDEAVPLEECARANCTGVPADQLADCVLGSCAVEFGATCPTCQACLAANVGSTIDDAVAACTQGGASYSYEGSFGIGFMSSEAFVEEDSLVLDSNLTRRAVLYVQIDDPALGPVHLFGTHLSPVFSSVPYPGEGTWEEEQAAQIAAMRDWIESKAGDEGPIVLLGDFNTGPEGAQYVAEAPENYDALVADGWRNAYADRDDGECTFCEDNALVGGDGEDGLLIDHILVLRFDGTVEIERILDDEIEIDTADGTVTTARSDHYGLAAVLSG